MGFRILGPVGVWADGRLVGPSTPQQRSVLAMLLLNVRQVVTTERLMRAVWGDEPPITARNAIHQYVSRLRRVLVPVPQAALVTAPPGYRLDVEPADVDLHRFRELVDLARKSVPSEADALFGQALRLWQGPPLANVSGDWLPAMFGQALTEERLAVVEEHVAVGLSLGTPIESLADLPMLISEHPLRERLTYLWMLSLLRDGRRAAALKAFRQARRRLVDELGVEPGIELQELHRRALSAEPAVEVWPYPMQAPADGTVHAPDTPPVPAELPAPPAFFAGRAAEIARVRTALTADRPAGPRVCHISGIGGIGKSALAVHVARGLVEHFPDGQLYVNLHGAIPQAGPVDPHIVLGRFLRSLGTADSAVPADLEEAAGRFRSLTDGKRVLIVLDNARDAAQVRPLLPGSATCAVLVTSRRMFTSLHDAVHVQLDVLDVGRGTDLLGGMVHDDRIAREPDAAAAVVRLCGGLPLALCLAAARLNGRPFWPVSVLAERLATARHRLDELRADDRAVRAVFQESYEDLRASPSGAEAARVFRYVGMLDGPDAGPTIVAAMTGLSEDRARDLLDTLVDAQLVESHAPDRYRLHDLLRLYARERAEAEDPAGRRAELVRRVLHCHLATARTAIKVLGANTGRRAGIGPRTLDHPGARLATGEDVHAWTDAEADNVLALVRTAAGPSTATLVVSLAATFTVLLYERGHWLKQLSLAQSALPAAAGTREILYEARIHGDLGWVQVCMGASEDGIAHLHRSLDAYRRAGEATMEAGLLDNLGVAYRTAGQPERAAEHHTLALRLNRELGDRWGEAVNLTHLGLVHQAAGRYDEAVELHTRSIELLGELGMPSDRLRAFIHRAEAYRRAGRFEEAVEHYRQAMAAHRKLGGSGDFGAAEISWGLGLVLYELGRVDEARQAWRRSITLLGKLGLITHAERLTAEQEEPPPTPRVIVRQR
ncbi:AfsR/SARP family transcriptional regulator [Nonomuraea diastatica]|uniref:AfsR/SARP family transcriptional regulator n=1 Tax=Nonomuraea diastatica TaxID=1848329 RepID=UPI001FE4321D|nr:BTAD domain-containing putative transcriptional regulator [Nonomuraea diastatica]